MLQGKYTLNKNQSIPCRCLWHGPLFFIHRFLCLVLLLLLYYSGKIAIPYHHMLLLIQILHLVLFKSLQLQVELSISGDNCVVFWWAIYGNRRLSFLKRADLPFVCNGFVAIYFWPIFVRQFRTFVLLVLQQCGDDCVVIGGRLTPLDISGCAICLVYGVQFKCKCEQLFVFYAFLWTCQVAKYCQIPSVGIFLLVGCRWQSPPIIPEES